MWKIPGSKRTFYRYAYDVDVEPKNSDLYYRRNAHSRLWEAHAWCDEHCRGPWSARVFTFSFDNKDDAMMFKLIWSGML